ncbi:MAG: TolC family protein [Nitrospirae bacterium]|nr:TolC family protein [Nitrospirota bacterium]
MYLILVSLFYVLFLSVTPSAAADRTVSLQEAYNLALKNHEAVRIAGEGLYQLEQTRKKAVSSILPSLTAEGSYTKYSEEKSSAVTVIQPDYSLNYSLILSLPIYRGGREWSALRQAKYMVDAGERGVGITKEDIVSAVANSYFGLIRIQREKEIKEADLKRAEERSRVASARFKVGEVTRTAVLRADAETAGIQADLSRVNKELRIAEDMLARLLGIPSGFSVSEPAGKQAPDGTVEEFIRTALSKRNDYRKTGAEVETAKEGIRYAKGGFMPTLRLDGVYSGRDQDPVSSSFYNKESIYASLTLSYPLYEGGLRIAEVREAESKYRETELRKLSLAKEIELGVRDASYNIDAINSAIVFYKTQVSFAEENYNTVFKQFSYGLAANADVIDANSTLVSAQKSYSNSIIDLQLAIIDLKKKMGLILDEVSPVEPGQDIRSHE